MRHNPRKRKLSTFGVTWYYRGEGEKTNAKNLSLKKKKKKTRKKKQKKKKRKKKRGKKKQTPPALDKTTTLQWCIKLWWAKNTI